MKNLIKVTVLALILTMSMGATADAAEKKVRWKLATTWGPTLAPFTNAVQSLADSVEKMSGGDFTIRIDPANKHKAPFGVF